jgi:hypothetical protein
MTNRGLNIHSELWVVPGDREWYVMRLNCTAIHEGAGGTERQRQRIGVPLALVNATTSLYKRTVPHLVYTGADCTKPEPLGFACWPESTFVNTSQHEWMQLSYDKRVLENPTFAGMQNIFVKPWSSQKENVIERYWIPPTLSLKRPEQIIIGNKYHVHAGRLENLELQSDGDGEADGAGEAEADVEFILHHGKMYLIELQVTAPEPPTTTPEPGLVVIIDFTEHDIPVASIRKRSGLDYTIGLPFNAPRIDPAMVAEEADNFVVNIHLRPIQPRLLEVTDRVGNVPEEIGSIKRYILEIAAEEKESRQVREGEELAAAAEERGSSRRARQQPKSAANSLLSRAEPWHHMRARDDAQGAQGPRQGSIRSMMLREPAMLREERPEHREHAKPSLLYRHVDGAVSRTSPWSTHEDT